MPELVTCPQCGGTIPPTAPAGLCPGCLLGLGLVSTPRPDGTADGPPTHPTVVPSSPDPAGLSFAPTTPGRRVPVDRVTPTGSAVLLAPETPAVLGNYELGEELGRGGMGTVFRAVQRLADRVVAVKILHGGLAADPGLRDRFADEVRVLARLDHPNIVAVHEVGEDRGTAYFSMEYAPGGSLARRLRSGGPLPPAESARLVEQLAQAVHAAHELGVLHRDVKPANVLLGADGRAMLSDFGLAKRLDRADGPTVTGQVMGTPNYMPPEQAAGARRAAVGPPADVWGLGATLYECLTGRPPFTGATTAETVRRVVARDPMPPRRLNPAVSADLEAVCLKCLEKDPARRYQSAAELADDLGRVARGEPTAARPASRLRRAWKRARRRPALAAAVALLVLGGAATWVMVPKDRRTPEEQLDRAARNGEKITLIGPVGHPKWLRWANGTGTTNDPDNGGPFEAQVDDTGLIELLPDTHTDRYRFSAEFRPTLSTNPDSWVGLYFAFQQGKVGSEGTADRAVLVRYRDDLISNLPSWKKGDAVNVADYIIGHAVQVGRNRAGGDLWPIGSAWINEPKPNHRPWRRIVADVTPDAIRVSFWPNRDGQPVEIGPISSESLRDRPPKHLERIRQWWPDIDPGELQYSPRGRLGVYVCNAKVFFRNVEFDPTPIPTANP